MLAPKSRAAEEIDSPRPLQSGVFTQPPPKAVLRPSPMLGSRRSACGFRWNPLSATVLIVPNFIWELAVNHGGS
jgi:hypothetical protein